jgi:hypothetical protein
MRPPGHSTAWVALTLSAAEESGNRVSTCICVNTSDIPSSVERCSNTNLMSACTVVAVTSRLRGLRFRFRDAAQHFPLRFRAISRNGCDDFLLSAHPMYVARWVSPISFWVQIIFVSHALRSFSDLRRSTPSGPLAIESKIPDVAILQNLLLANTCILHSGRIVATPRRSFFVAGSAEIPGLLRFRCWKNRLTFLNLRAKETGKANP